jgi:disulfide bond formation protein DsbB
MRSLPVRSVAFLSVVAAAAALGIAYASETWGGMAPCALCLVERWPYRIAIALGVIALVTPASIGRWVLVLLALTVLGDAAIAAVHVGVEFGWWPSPLPECAAPHLVLGGSGADQFASLPARPAKPCDDPNYLIPGLPLSMAAMNLLYALAFAMTVGVLLGPRRRRRR